MRAGRKCSTASSPAADAPRDGRAEELLCAIPASPHLEGLDRPEAIRTLVAGVFEDSPLNGLKLGPWSVNVEDVVVEARPWPHSEAEALRTGWSYLWNARVTLRASDASGELEHEVLERCVLFPRFTQRGTWILRSPRGADAHERIPVAQLIPRCGLLVTAQESDDGVRTIRATLHDRDGQWVQVERRGEGRAGAHASFARGRIRLADLLDGPKDSGSEPSDAEVRREKGLARWRAVLEQGAFRLTEDGRQRIESRLGGASQATEPHLTLADLQAVDAALASGFDEGHAPLDDVEHLKHYRVRLAAEFLERALSRGIRFGVQSLRRLVEGDGQGPVLWKGRIDLRPGEEDAQRDARSELHAWGRILGAHVDAYLQHYLNGPLCPFLEDTNPLTEASHKRSITFLGPGGLPSKYRQIARRGLHYSHQGRLCPIETPETDKIGLVLHLALLARVQDGVLRAPLLKDGQVCWASAEDEEDWLIVSHPGARFGRRGADELVELDRDTRPDALEIHPAQALGLAAVQVPFLHHNDAVRVVMGAKNLKQAVPLVAARPPRVRSGFETLVVDLSGWVVRARQSGRVEEATADHVGIRGDDGGLHDHPLTSRVPGRAGHGLYHEPRVREGDEVRAGTVLATAPAVSEDGCLALGVDLLVAYLPWKGYNYQDAVVVSRSGADRLSSWRFKEIRHAFSAVNGRPPSIRERVSVGDAVVAGLNVASAGPETFVAPDDAEGEVVSVATRSVGIGAEVIVTVRTPRPLAVGDKLMGRHGNKGVVSVIVPDEEMPHLDGRPVEVVMNPHSVISRKNLGQILETQLPRREGFPSGEPFRATDETLLEGKQVLTDGQNGRPFDAPCVVGLQYVVKLNHLAVEKWQARGTGPNAAVTDQPTAGRRNRGGQRLGEMEGWALQAHGAWTVLWELTTAMSDHVGRRRRWWTGLVSANRVESSHAEPLPETFRVVQILLRALGLQMTTPNGEPLPLPAYDSSSPPADSVGVRLTLASGDEMRRWGEPVSDRDQGADVWAQLSCGCEGFSRTVLDGSKKGYVCARCQKKVTLTPTDRVARWDPAGSRSELIFGEDKAARRSTMGWVALPEALPHPLLEGEVLEVLPIIPPSLRPLLLDRRDEESELSRAYGRMLRAITAWRAHSGDGERRWSLRARARRALAELFEVLMSFLEGKFGILRHFLLGKRVDYSARCVITPRPDLPMDRCALPPDVVVALFGAPLQKVLAGKAPLVFRNPHEPAHWLALKLALERLDPVVLLNRPPSLHRYNLLAFRPVLGRGYVIGLPPAVCTGYNADFDGDQMAVFSTWVSGDEALDKMSPRRHLVSAASGRMLAMLDQDLALGLYYGALQYPDEFAAAVPEVGVYDWLFREASRSAEEASLRMDALVPQALEWATRSGVSPSISDLDPFTLSEKDRMHLLQGGDYDRLMRAATDWIQERLGEEGPRLNPIALLVSSGARGSAKDVCQMAALRGSMDRAGGGSTGPVRSGLRQGLSSQEFFISCYGARKTLIDKKLNTAPAGDLTRRMVEAAYALRISARDCVGEGMAPPGMTLPPDAAPSLRQRVIGRVLVDGRGPLDEAGVEEVLCSSPGGLAVRSPLTCLAEVGVCARCCGWDPGLRAEPEVGFPVGILAAQSVGERGTQLTMQTFHQGGVRTDRDISRGLQDALRLLENWQVLLVVDGEVRRLRLGDLLRDGADFCDFVERFLGEMYGVYKAREVLPIHFEVILRALLTRDGGSLRYRGLTDAGRGQPGWLGRASFREARAVLQKVVATGEVDPLTSAKAGVMLGRPGSWIPPAKENGTR